MKKLNSLTLSKLKTSSLGKKLLGGKKDQPQPGGKKITKYIHDQNINPKYTKNSKHVK